MVFMSKSGNTCEEQARITEHRARRDAVILRGLQILRLAWGAQRFKMVCLAFLRSIHNDRRRYILRLRRGTCR